MRRIYLFVIIAGMLIALLAAYGGAKTRQRTLPDTGKVAADATGSVAGKLEFSQAEEAKLTGLLGKLPEQVKQEFATRYQAWKATWDDPRVSVHSDPGMYAQSRQYEEFLDYCKRQGKAVWPLLFQRLAEGDPFVAIPILNLTLPDYEYLLDEIRQESARERYTPEGLYITPSAQANMLKYVKKLLSEM